MNMNTKTETKPAIPATDLKPIQTKHLAAKFGIKATALRRILRSMPAYADGVHTNYRWAENDPAIAQIDMQIKKLARDKQERATAAKAALDARTAASAKQAAADAKLVQPAK